MRRAALVGVMGYGQQHLRILAGAEALGRLRLDRVAVASRAEAAEVLEPLALRGVRIFDDWREMLAPEAGPVELVCLPTPIHLHAEMVQAALAAGADVLVEKPLAGSLAEADAVIAAARAAGRKVAVGFQEVSTRIWQVILAGLAAGRLGALKEVRGYGLWPRNSTYYKRNNWAGRMRVGGHPVFDSPLNNALAHYVHLLLVAAGSGRRTARVTAITGECWRAQDIENYDTATFRAETDAGVAVTFAASHSCAVHEDPVIRIMGESGELTWQFGRGVSGIWADGERLAMNDPVGWKKREAMMAAVLDWFGGDEHAPVCTLESARAHVELVEALAAVAPPQEVAPKMILRRREVGGGEQRCLRGVEDAVRAVLVTGKPFAGADLGWAG